MSEIKNDISEKHKLQLNRNNNEFNSNPTYPNIFQNPIKHHNNANYIPNNSYSFIQSHSNSKENQNYSKKELNITSIEPELLLLNNTFPNQQQLENNINEDISCKYNNTYNIVKRNSLNNFKDEIIREYKSLTDDNDEQLNELALNIKENENKINQITKTMNLIMQSKNNDMDIENEKYFIQINDIEKIQQENITLKADSIILREDISNLVKLNDKYTQDLENARNKIMDLIERNNELENDINHKEYQKEKLNEILTRLKLYENQDVEYKIINNKTKEEVLIEVEHNIKIQKEANNKLIKDKKILEEKIKLLIENNNDINRNISINNERENKIMNELEEKLQKLEKGIQLLNDENKILYINNSKMEKEIQNINESKNNYEIEYNKIKAEFDKLQFSFNNLYKKYQHMLIESNKKSVKKEILKRNKSERKLKANKSLINELYNKIQILKSKVKNDRKLEN